MGNVEHCGVSTIKQSTELASQCFTSVLGQTIRFVIFYSLSQASYMWEFREIAINAGYTTQRSHLSCLSSYSHCVLVFTHITGRDCLLLTSVFYEHTAWFVYTTAYTCALDACTLKPSFLRRFCLHWARWSTWLLHAVTCWVEPVAVVVNYRHTEYVWQIYTYTHIDVLYMKNLQLNSLMWCECKRAPISDLCIINSCLFEEGYIYFCLCLLNVGLVSQAFSFCSADCFQYPICNHPCGTESIWLARLTCLSNVTSWKNISLENNVWNGL